MFPRGMGRLGRLGSRFGGRGVRRGWGLVGIGGGWWGLVGCSFVDWVRIELELWVYFLDIRYYAMQIIIFFGERVRD